MKCPICNDVRMREVQKDGVLIDICPECKGVWLDRGELDKLLNEVREIRPAFNDWYDSREQDHDQRYQDEKYRSPQPRTDHDDSYYRQGNYKGDYKRKKKKSVLDVFGDLFD